MNQPIEQLAVRLQSNVLRDRQLAAKAAGAVLGWTFVRDVRPDLREDDEQWVPDDIRSQPPTDEDGQDLVAVLHRIFLESLGRPDDDRVELLRAIGKAKPWLSAPVFIDLLVEHREALRQDEIHEIVHALDRSLHLIRDNSRLPLVAKAFARPRARIVIGDVAHSPSESWSCMPYDAKRILAAIANRISDQIAEAREYTAQLRGSEEHHWPTTRMILRDRTIDPGDTAIGGWIPEQEGPFLILVVRGGPTAILELEYLGGQKVEFLDWQELDPLRSYPYSLHVHAALIVLSDESPVALDPVDVLVEAVEHATNDLRHDGGFFQWGGLRRFLVEHRSDPTSAILFGTGETWSTGRTPERYGTLLCDGRFLAFVMDVNYPSGVGRAAGELARIRMWQIDEVQARLQHGALIDAAVRLETNERRARFEPH